MISQTIIRPSYITPYPRSNIYVMVTVVFSHPICIFMRFKPEAKVRDRHDIDGRKT